MASPSLHPHPETHEAAEHTAAERSVHAPTLGRMVLGATSRHQGTALRYKQDGTWRDMTYAELGSKARELARGLIGLGIKRGDRVSILGNTRPEWTICDCAVLLAGATLVPIYQTNSPDECQYVLEHSDARLVFCENAEQVAKVMQVRDRCPALEHVIAMEPVEGVMSLDGLRAAGAEIGGEAPDKVVEAVGPDEIATIVYTSGTTGPPKGCMHTHANWMAAVEISEERLEFLEGDVVIYMFLPLAHAFARVTQYVTLDVGGTLAYWQGEPKKILEDLAEIEPTYFPSVPRIFEKAYTRVTSALDEGSAVKRALGGWAIGVGRQMAERTRAGKPVPAPLRAQHALADRLVLSKVREVFGPRLRMAITGAAPIPRDVLEFFDAVGVRILEGYGMTETSAVTNVNTREERRLGTVGKPLPRTDIEIAEDGEVLMRGPQIFRGYWKNDEATAETFRDGWLLSGDLGSLDDQGYLSITGRKKDLIITSSGKNITPSNLEGALRESRWISQAVVYGDNHPYLVAVLTLDPEEAPALAERIGCEPDVAAMAQDHDVIAELQKDVDEVNERFARIEQVKRFAILDHDLTQEGGELTPTLKVKRAVVYDRFRDIFEGLYD